MLQASKSRKVVLDLESEVMRGPGSTGFFCLHAVMTKMLLFAFLELGPVFTCFQVIFEIVEDQNEKAASQLHKEMRFIENVT